MKKSIAVLGTMSSAGKSTVALLLIRYLYKYHNLDIVPFKGQNMSLNSKVTPTGEEIATAQYYQALAAGKIPNSLMNPILLKPGNPKESFLIIRGKPHGNINSKNWISPSREWLWKIVKDSLNQLMAQHDYIVIEGAGSPAEINLKKYDITNMRVVLEAQADTILVADIDRGGSFAQIVGTMELLSEEERTYIKVFVLNKFRVDETLLKDGIDYLYQRYKIPTVVIPYVRHNLPEEDGIKDLSRFPRQENDITIGIVKLPHMSNHDDFDPLYGNVNVISIEKPQDIDMSDIIIIPGSRKVVYDLKYLRKSGIADYIIKAHKKGKYIIGICGGFQMLGKYIHDPLGIESDEKIYPALGIIDTETTLQEEKILKLNKGYIKSYIQELGGIYVEGYEIHHGITTSKFPFLQLEDREDGYYHNNIIGTYLHGIFANQEFTERLLNLVRKEKHLPTRKFTFIHPLQETDRILTIVEEPIKRIVSYLDIK